MRGVSIKELGRGTGPSRNTFVDAAEGRARAGGAQSDPFKDGIPAALEGGEADRSAGPGGGPAPAGHSAGSGPSAAVSADDQPLQLDAEV